MYSLVLKISFTFLTLTTMAFANEEAPAEHGAAPAAPAKEIKSSEDSYAVVQARVQALEAKVRSAETEIQKLITEKQQTKDSSRVAEIINQMKSLHKDLNANVKEYDQQRALLKYRYPEKGLTEKREYERIEVKSIEEMETQMSLGNTVKKTLQKVRMQYEKPEKNELGTALVEEKKKSPESAPRIVDPIILKK
ncbi:MAG: hypothetical protein OM95_14515 [Bdellovibrio sp. ArHS]|uniref:hypothetical protein n=1 Tax=Bdellovibrio sp. ArHS TaxID=1569284 RepID=UPI000583B0F7|nr:hypothetical protein [Bdellovibrio sp. ArHS]KHD87401.1 MAG: hypothetical protein OM95_14515 [Bdellovibrio sp. ArHS]